jgi:signal peptidase II
MSYGEGFNILGLDWARIHFVENKGMAFGLEFGGTPGKLLLSSFRIVMVGFLIYIIRGLIKTGESFGLLLSFALIIAGAIGNILDSAFYGIFFSESRFHGEPAQFLSDASGTIGFLQGKVVDMFYFPMFEGTFPEWFPFWGGERFEFFRPVFNVADAAISVGVASIILFHRRFFKAPTTEANEQKSSELVLGQSEEE